MELTLVYQVEKRRIHHHDWVVLHKEKRMAVTHMTAKRVHTARPKFDRLTGREILRQDERIGNAYIYTALRVEDEQGNLVWTFDNGLSK